MIHLALSALLTLAAAGTEAPREAGTDVPAPIVLSKVDPLYPPEAERQAVSGIVILELVIDEEGHVADAKVVRGVALLDKAAIEAVRQWTFEVTRVEGRPVRVRHVVSLSFARRLSETPGVPLAQAPRAAADVQGSSAPPPVDVVQTSSDLRPAPLLPDRTGVSTVPGVGLAEGVPDLVSGRRPVVPPMARIKGVRGTVMVRFSLDDSGATEIRSIEGPELLKPQADHAIQSWKFRRMTAGRLFLVATFTYEGNTAKASVATEDQTRPD